MNQIDLAYLQNKLTPLGYQLDEKGELPILYKRVLHKNPISLYAFTLIIITLDKYTITIEGFNEMLINRAVKAKAISIDTFEELDALREIVYDDTLEDINNFDKMFDFFEKQMSIIVNEPVQSDEHGEALENIQLMVKMANEALH